MIDCAHAASLIELRLDGETTAEDDRSLDAHVAGCPACAAQLAAETTLDAALVARFARTEAPSSLAAGVRRRIDAEAAAAPIGAGWIADALNAAGVVVAVVAAGVAGQGRPAAGAAIGLAALLVACYPLVLSGLAGDAGPGEAGPAHPARQI